LSLKQAAQNDDKDIICLSTIQFIYILKNINELRFSGYCPF